VMPLLPQHQAEACLVEALKQLASHTSPAWLSAAGATTPPAAQAADVAGGVAAHGLGGVPARIGMESLVKLVVEKVLHTCLSDDGGLSPVQAVLRSFNDALQHLADAVRTTAHSPAATWGLPAPELCATTDSAAPRCWHPSAVEAAANALMHARVPMYAADSVQGVAPGDMRAAVQAAAGILHAHFNQWAASRAAAASEPSSCLLLPQLVPRIPVASQLPPPGSHTPGSAQPGSARQGFAPTSFLARSPGGFPLPYSPAMAAGGNAGNAFRHGSPHPSYAQAVMGGGHGLFGPHHDSREPETPGFAKRAAFGGQPAASPGGAAAAADANAHEPPPQQQSPWQPGALPLQPVNTSAPAQAPGSALRSPLGADVGAVGLGDPAAAADAWEAKSRAHAVLGELLELIGGGAAR